MKELPQLSKILVREFPEDISVELCNQVLLLIKTGSKLQNKTISELTQFLLIQYIELASSFSEVMTAWMLYLSLPAAEEKFLKVEIDKIIIS